MNISFEGQVALITGATRGIGRHIAEACGRLGGELLLTGTDPEQVAVLNAEAQRDTSSRRTWWAVDFSNREQTGAFLDRLAELPRVDVCVNNAGINRIAEVEATRPEDWDDVMAVNLRAPYLVTRAIAPVMKQNRYGRIVNIASIFGVISKPRRSLYSMSKFGLRGLTVAAALELARFGVLVNSVSPGFVITDLTERILSPDEIEQLTAQVPVGRFAEAAEIARVVLFLASRENTYLTGQNIVVDGGFVNA
jgi:3-oxoacyl-[acyl-carrier protein] reductase